MKLPKSYSFDIIFNQLYILLELLEFVYFQSYFLKTSFISIVIPLSLFLYRVKPNKKDSILMFLVYIIAFFSEWIGVCFGWLFGDYTYGDSLGFKLDGVPIIMGQIGFYYV